MGAHSRRPTCTAWRPQEAHQTRALEALRARSEAEAEATQRELARVAVVEVLR